VVSVVISVTLAKYSYMKYVLMCVLCRFADRAADERHIRVHDMLQHCEMRDGSLELFKLLSQLSPVLHQALGKQLKVKC